MTLPPSRFLIIVGLMCAAGLLAVFGLDGTWQNTAAMCVLSISFSVGVLGPRISRIQSTAVPDFLTVFLLFQIANKVMTIISLAFGLQYMTSWERADLVAPTYALQAEFIHLVGTVLFSAGWILVESRQRSTSDLARTYSTNSLLQFYVAAMVASLFLQFGTSRFSFGLLSTFAMYSSLGAVGLLLASSSRWGLNGSYRIFTVLLLAPLFYLAMISGTKGQMVVVALPIIMAAMARGFTRVIFVLLPFAIFMLTIGIPLSQEMRYANWESVGRGENIGLSEGLKRVSEQYSAGNGTDLIARTLVQFCNRASSSEMGGVVMRYADKNGLIGFETVRLLPAMFIPRALWPDKPVFRPGAWFTWYRGRADSPETATSATAMMLGTEFYWSFGVLGVLFMSLLGALYAAVWRALGHVSRLGMTGFAGMYALLGAAVRFEEGNIVYSVSAPIAFLAYSYVLVGIERSFRAILGASARRR